MDGAEKKGLEAVFRPRSVAVVGASRREEAIGTLTLERRQRPGPWLREQIDLARAIAYQAASAIGAARPRR